MIEDRAYENFHVHSTQFFLLSFDITTGGNQILM